MIRVVLPAPLRGLARVDREVTLDVARPVTVGAVLDALEAAYPVLRGTIRDHGSGRRRPFIRFFAAGQDLSHAPPDAPLPDAVATGAEPFLVVGALAGGDGRRDRSAGGGRATYALWTVQALLALLFLWAGGTKLVLPLAALAGPLPGPLLRVVGVLEVLGALGLVLPGLLGIGPRLTPLAATGLAILMLGATVVTLVSGGGTAALLPLGVGLLAAFVAYGRWQLAPPG